MKVNRYMTGVEWDNFEAQDQKKYCVKENLEFLEWLNKKIEDGYSAYLKTEELQKLIDFIALWYQIRYPDESHFESTIECVHPSPNNTLAQAMDYEQLMLRLYGSLKDLMECSYSGSIYNSHIKLSAEGNYEKEIRMGCEVGDKTKKLRGYEESPYLLTTSIYYSVDGIIEPHRLEEIRVFEPITTIEELLSYLEENHREDLDYSQIKKCVFNHQTDLELRRKVLELVPLKLLYSNNPSQGYVQALEMIKEFNQQIPGLNLNSEEIDEIMSRDYSKKQLEFEEEISAPDLEKSETTFFEKTRNVFQKIFPKRT